MGQTFAGTREDGDEPLQGCVIGTNFCRRAAVYCPHIFIPFHVEAPNLAGWAVVMGDLCGSAIPTHRVGFLLRIADSSPVISKFDYTLIIVYCRLETIELPSVCTFLTSSTVKNNEDVTTATFVLTSLFFSNIVPSPDENLCRLLELHAPTRWRPISVSP